MPDDAEKYKIYQEWIEKCQTSDKLTEWEANFVASVKRYLETRGGLSSKQVEILERIYADKTD